MILPTHNSLQPTQPDSPIALMWVGACRSELWVDSFQPSGVERAVVTRFPIVQAPPLGCNFGRYASKNNPTIDSNRYASIVTPSFIANSFSANSMCSMQPKCEVSTSSAGCAVGTSLSTSPRDKITETQANKSTKSTNPSMSLVLPNVLCGNALKLARMYVIRVGWLK